MALPEQVIQQLSVGEKAALGLKPSDEDDRDVDVDIDGGDFELCHHGIAAGQYCATCSEGLSGKNTPDRQLEGSMFGSTGRTLTPLDGASRTERFFTRREVDPQPFHPPPSREGSIYRKPNLFTHAPDDIGFGAAATSPTRQVNKHNKDASDNHMLDHGYKGSSPYVTTYFKTFAPDLTVRKSDVDFESHEGKAKPRRSVTQDSICQSILLQVGDKLRQKKDGRKRLQQVFMDYKGSRDLDGGPLALDQHELRAALRLFNVPLSREQSSVLFTCLGLGQDDTIDYKAFCAAVKQAETKW